MITKNGIAISQKNIAFVLFKKVKKEPHFLLGKSGGRSQPYNLAGSAY
jgi:hypothetical protein